MQAAKIYRHECDERISTADVDVGRFVAEIAARLHHRLADVSTVHPASLEDEIPELRGDARLIELLGASVEGNVDTLLHALRHDIAVERVEAPTAALEYARRLAQHGVPVNALVRAYRLGQRRMNELVFREVRRRPTSGGDGQSPCSRRCRQPCSSTSTGYRSRSSKCTKTSANAGWRTRTAFARCGCARSWPARQAVDVDAATRIDPLSAALASSGRRDVVPGRGQRRRRTAPGCNGSCANSARPPSVGASPLFVAADRTRMGMATVPRRADRRSRQRCASSRPSDADSPECGDRHDGGGCRRISPIASRGRWPRASVAVARERTRADRGRRAAIPVCRRPRCSAATSARPGSGWPKCSVTWRPTPRTTPACARRCGSSCRSDGQLQAGCRGARPALQHGEVPGRAGGRPAGPRHRRRPARRRTRPARCATGTARPSLGQIRNRSADVVIACPQRRRHSSSPEDKGDSVVPT